jgi:hypothetical protein
MSAAFVVVGDVLILSRVTLAGALAFPIFATVNETVTGLPITNELGLTVT